MFGLYRLLFITSAILFACLRADFAAAQPAAQTPAPAASSGSLSEIIFAGGVPGFLIVALLLLLSMGGLALGVEHALTIRRKVMMPAQVQEQLTEVLAQGQVGKAIKLCEATPCPLADIVRASLVEAEGGWPAAEKGLEEEAAEQAGRLFRKIEYLSVLGNIAPMVGLLGTVIGMILAFREVADTQGAARAGELASGIYQALVTTVGGLLVAIPSLAAYAVFRNRVDQLMAETVSQARRVLVPVKRALVGRNPSVIGSSAPPQQG